jgi:outer membrane protein OmpA-like peptidoglycan-associated protein
MQFQRITLALIVSGICLPGPAYADDAYSPAWWLNELSQACQVVADGIARCLPPAGAPPGTLPPCLVSPQPVPWGPASGQAGGAQAWPSTIARAPSNNPYLVHTPYAARPATSLASAPAPSGTPASLPPAAAPTAMASLPNPALSAPAALTQPGVDSSNHAAGLTAPPLLLAASPTAQPASPAPVQSAATSLPTAAGAAPGNSLKLGDARAHFEFDQAELSDTGRGVLDAWLHLLNPGQQVRIIGHADRFGTRRYNLALSRRRAESVVRHLTDKGMRANDLVIVARGESQPIVSCQGGPTPETKACLAANRRVELTPG